MSQPNLLPQEHNQHLSESEWNRIIQAIADDEFGEADSDDKEDFIHSIEFTWEDSDILERYDAII
jgi:hypothetical protein